MQNYQQSPLEISSDARYTLSENDWKPIADFESVSQRTEDPTSVTFPEDLSYDSESSYSSDSDASIDDLDFYDEVEKWMKSLTQTKTVPPKKVYSMPLLGAVNKTPKYQEQISHHPLVASRINQCKSQFFQNPEEVSINRDAKKNPAHEKPEDRVKAIFARHGLSDIAQFEPKDGDFLAVTEERVSSHSKEMTDAARNVDLKRMKHLYREGQNLQACNKYGESLVHIVCRRGSHEGLQFLIRKAKVSLMVRDDFGRNPLHDAMWTNSPSFEMVRLLLQVSPTLLFAKDSRGSTPMAYIPRPRWSDWSEFFEENQDIILAPARN